MSDVNKQIANIPVVLPEPDFLQRHEDVCGDEVGPPTAFYTADTVRALLATGGKAQADKEMQLAMQEASSLAQSIFKRHYSDDEHYASGSVVWGLCDSLRGVISQIDNMTSGLVRAPHAQADMRDAEQERWMGIGKAIERACIDQPESTEIVISLERDAGTVTMFDPDGNEHDQFSHEDGFAGVVNAAIEAAIEAAKEQG